MWITVKVEKTKEYDVEKIADLLDLSFGVVYVKPVLIKDVTGIYTRLYDSNYPGQTIEVFEDGDYVCLNLNFPAGPYDIELFFKLTGKVCEYYDREFFAIGQEEYDIYDLDEITDAYIEYSDELLLQLKNEVDEGQRDGYVVFGTLFPIILSPKQIIEIDGKSMKLAQLVQNYQSKDVEYLSPNILTIYSTKKRWGIYELTTNKNYVLAYDPWTLISQSGDDIKEFLIDFGYVQFRYEDFIKEIVDIEPFDLSHMIVNISEKQITDLIQKISFDPESEKYIYKPTYGIEIMNGDYHASKVSSKELDTDYLNGYSHLAIYLRWFTEKGFLNHKLEEFYPGITKTILDPKKDIRLLIKEHEAFRGRISAGHFESSVERFVLGYADSYPENVDDYALKLFGEEKYNSEEFKTEAYLFVNYDEVYYKGLSQYIENAYKEYLKKNSKLHLFETERF